ncbi:MAG: glycosyltransferase family 4 protein [Bacteroidales bacterium]|nr:glycosyltransferase family 4 protein [Bacteroidales bacterium]MBK9356500.1 glycosyltransferase family 4 protein [Bacteroidales bacterium]
MNISVFNGAGQVDYMYGLVSGLAHNKADEIDVLDVDLTSDIFQTFSNVNYHPVFRVLPRSSPFYSKATNTLRFYSLQIWFLISKKARIVHFQWLDRFIYVDRIVLPLIARLSGHRVVLTVHNINAGKRDKRDSFGNRMSLKILYRLANRLIVHTEKSKEELMAEFPIKESKIAVIKHGMNNRVTISGLSASQARKQLQINEQEKVVLFFGNIDYYKGLDILLDSFREMPEKFLSETRLLIAGNSKSPEYSALIQKKIEAPEIRDRVSASFGYIRDEDVEMYFMAADCIVLPYRNIYQSGVIFMAYTFGLPLIVADIGNFRNDMVEGETGFLINMDEPAQVGKTLLKYFDSGMYRNLPETREKIKNWAWQNYSWDQIGAETRKLYESIR